MIENASEMTSCSNTGDVIDAAMEAHLASGTVSGGPATVAANATLGVTGGAAGAQGTAGTDGRFSIPVTLLSDTVVTLSVTARDASGNVSQPSTVSFTVDCTPPHVLDVVENPSSVVVTFDEAILASSIRAGDTARLDTSGTNPTPIPATASLSADGKTLGLDHRAREGGGRGQALRAPISTPFPMPPVAARSSARAGRVQLLGRRVPTKPAGEPLLLA